MSDLQELYEAVLGYPLNRGNFYRRVKRYQLLEIPDKGNQGSGGNLPIRYRFNLKNYFAMLNEVRW